MSTDTDTRHVSRPTRTSTAIVLVVSLAVVAALLWQVQRVLVPALVGAAGAVAFAASLWLVSLDRSETVAAVAASLLTVPVAVGLLVGTLGTVLVLVGAFFPVESASALSLRTLLLVSRLGVVVGCVSAVLGMLLGIRNVVDRESLARHYWLTLKTGLVPAVVGVAMVAGTYLSKRSAGTAESREVTGVVDGAIGTVLAPTATTTHLATFFALLALAALSARAAVGALPVAELLADSGVGETEERRVSQVRDGLGWVATGSVVAALAGGLLELGLGPVALRDLLGPALYRPLAALTALAPLRLLFVAVAVVALPTVLGVRLLRRAARGSLTDVVRQVGPFAGGALVTVAAAVFARPILRPLVDWTAGRLPAPAGTLFEDAAQAFVRVFGAPAIVVVLAAVLVTLTAGAVLTFRLAVFAGYLSEGTSGYSLASGGLFVATAFAGTIGVEPWLVFAGVVGSLLVWDVGQYGTTLGREIGRAAPSRGGELVHAGGTLAVGLVGVALATTIAAVFESGAVTESPTTVVALAGVLVGILSLAVALR